MHVLQVFLTFVLKLSLLKVSFQEDPAKGPRCVDPSESYSEVRHRDVQAAASYRRLLYHHLRLIHTRLQHTGC